MPTYEYRCEQCGETFEHRETIAEHETAKPQCPKCGGEKVKRAEGHQDVATDTYYASGILQGTDSGRRYAFLTIVAKNERIFSVLSADFYVLAFFDLGTGRYDTISEFDLPPGARVQLLCERGEGRAGARLAARRTAIDVGHQRSSRPGALVCDHGRVSQRIRGSWQGSRQPAIRVAIAVRNTGAR